MGATPWYSPSHGPPRWADDNPAHVQQALEQLAVAKPVCPNCHAPLGGGDATATAMGALGPPRPRLLSKEDEQMIWQWLQRKRPDH